MANIEKSYLGIPGIYKITSPTGSIYIGKSVDIGRRFIDYRKRSCKSQPHLYNSLTKYGSANHQFEVLHELPVDISREVLDRYECLYIDQFRECGFQLMNLKEGGSGGKISEESIKRMREKLKGRTAHNKGVPMSDEQRNKLSEAKKGIAPYNKGVKMNEEQKRNRKRPSAFSEQTKKRMAIKKKEFFIKNPDKAKEVGLKLKLDSGIWRKENPEQAKEQIITLRKNSEKWQSENSDKVKEMARKATEVYKEKCLNGEAPYQKSVEKRKGVPLSAEHRAKLSAATKGRIKSKEWVEKIAAANRKK